tara:strand:+ start:4014 stop:4673 length:660 start_codon:yes stop_codon:yes gene_type:complete
MILAALSDYPGISLIETPNGYKIRDDSNNMEMTLSLDNYERIISENKRHQLSRILKSNRLQILDCTGGFARDAAILASLGNHITLVEQNPLVMALLINAKKNIKSNNLKLIFNRITTQLGNCIDFIRRTSKKFDYIYFDFMFNSNKSSLPSKKEQFLRKIVKNDISKNLDILRETLQRVSSRIIIKEHISSNDYKNFDIINTYKGKTVKYHLLKGKNGR